MLLLREGLVTQLLLWHWDSREGLRTVQRRPHNGAHVCLLLPRGLQRCPRPVAVLLGLGDRVGCSMLLFATVVVYREALDAADDFLQRRHYGVDLRTTVYVD